MENKIKKKFIKIRINWCRTINVVLCVILWLSLCTNMKFLWSKALLTFTISLFRFFFFVLNIILLADKRRIRRMVQLDLFCAVNCAWVVFHAESGSRCPQWVSFNVNHNFLHISMSNQYDDRIYSLAS